MGIIGTVLLLATEALAESESAEGGFGLNLDILETNIINLAILIGVLFYFGRKVVGNTLSDRRSNIETAIREAEERLKEAAGQLSDAQQKLTKAQAEAQQIRKAAEENAQATREAILAKAAEDVQRLKETAARDLSAERERAIAQLRQQVVAMALQKAESELKSGIADNTQQTLIDRSIALLGGKG
ncbi:MAG: F0F1 ATP synthase subunit B [Chlorogloeopsis fritschii C42_A2020_084]|uniref:F0F1 ATP synthase subunit B n=1 Tax=Chlorogloeopsis fritschii TaxID=1124 RepID=UPI0019FC83AB|nr:F0F1 ATP synthase subunit B [Chlorogloeopsis fritschii]MBF2004526.1 F0F1 ATP synthase subunit B [Chlorogloeopsis fritschii C42_A2020_084]